MGSTEAGTELHQGRFRLEVRKKKITLRVVRHWHRLPSKAADPPWLSVFKRHLDNTLNDTL